MSLEHSLLEDTTTSRRDRPRDKQANTNGLTDTKMVSESDEGRAGGPPVRGSVALRRRANVPLLVGTAAAALVIGVVSFFWYGNRTKQTAESMILRADRLAATGDWSAAAAYMARALAITPEDEEVRLQMTDYYVDGATTQTTRERAIRVLYQTLGLLNEETDPAKTVELKRHLARLLYEAYVFSDAKQVALEIQDDPEGLRLLALASYADALMRDQVEVAEEARQHLEIALAVHAGDAEIAAAGAHLYRIFADEFRRGGMDAGVVERRPREILDRLIAVSADDPAAWVARYTYRRLQYGDEAGEAYDHPTSDNSPTPKNDLEQALQLDPDYPDALQLQAQALMEPGESQDLVRAETNLQQLLAEHTGHERAYVELSRVFQLQGNPDKAIEVLRSADRALGGRSIVVQLQLVEALLRSEEIGAAREILSSATGALTRRSAEFSSENRAQLDLQNRYLEARLLLAEQRFDDALTTLRTVIISTEARAEQPWAGALLTSSRVLLADTWSRAGAYDRAAETWQQILGTISRGQNVSGGTSIEPLEPHWYAAENYLAAGLHREAIAEYERYLELLAERQEPQQIGSRDQAWLKLLQAHLAQQLLRPPVSRNWAEFQRAFRSAREALGDRAEFWLAQAEYLMSLDDDPQRRLQVLSLLNEMESRFGDQPPVQRAIALAFQRIGETAKAERARDRFAGLVDSVSDSALLELALLEMRGETEKADRVLAAAIERATEAELPALRQQQILLAWRRGQTDVARDLLAEMDNKSPSMAALAWELAFTERDFDACLEYEQALESSTDVLDVSWRTRRIRRQLAVFPELSVADRRELSRTIGNLRAERPRWYPALAIAGHHAQVTGDSSRAIQSYSSAVELGDRRSSTLEALVSLLTSELRYAEADQVLALLRSQSPGDVRHDKMAIEFSVLQDDLGSALDRAAAASRDNPHDPVRGFWHARLLMANQRLQEAEVKFRELTQAFPEDAGIWMGLFDCLVRSQREQDARAVLAAMLEGRELSGLEKGKRRFVAGQCHELLGEWPEARQHYEASVSAAPEEVLYRVILAQLLLKIDLPAARRELEEIVRRRPDNLATRKQLAFLLASSGNDEDWERAESLLGEPDGESPAVESVRLRALLLTRRGRNRSQRIENYELARQLIESVFNDRSQPPADADRLLLGQIYEHLAMFRSDQELLGLSREQYRSLVDRSGSRANRLETEIPFAYLANFLEFLFRHYGATGADRVELDDETKQLYLAEIKTRVDQINARARNDAARRGNNALAENLTALSFRLRLMKLEPEGEKFSEDINRAANQMLARAGGDAQQLQVYLGLGNLCSALDLPAEAEVWYRRLAGANPAYNLLVATSVAARGEFQEAIELARQATEGRQDAEVKTFLLRLLAVSNESNPTAQALESRLFSLINERETNVGLLMSAATLQAQRGNDEQALALFHRVVELEPNNVLALNNLATFLAEEPGESDRALATIDQAIGIAGREPALLDTQGTILLLAGESEEAVSSLEEAAAGIVHDPRVHLHLAAAYAEVGRNEDARTSFQAADFGGIEETILTEHDRLIVKTLREQFALEPAAH